MKLEHVAIWTDRLEELKDYYVKYFDGVPNKKYTNPARGFNSYFISFENGARLELMTLPGIPDNLNDKANKQYKGIIHLAFSVKSIEEVDAKASQFKAEGLPVLHGPRKTGDGYYLFETFDPDNNRLEVTYQLP